MGSFPCPLDILLNTLDPFFNTQGSGSDGHRVVGLPPAPNVSADPPLLAALTQLNAYPDEVSPEEMFIAMHMCKLEHEGGTAFDAPQAQ